MDKLYDAIGCRIRAERARRGLTLRELASTAGITPSYLGQVELGSRKLSLATLVRLAHALGIVPWSLLAEPQAMPRLQWEDRIASLIRGQPVKRKVLVFKTLKFLLRSLRRQ